jgi:hypothetical protein
LNAPPGARNDVAMASALRPSRAGLGALLTLAGLAAAGPAGADWPMARHDPQRTGAAQGKSDIQTPAVAWRTYLGGSLRPDGLLAADVEGNGHDALIRSSGGSVAAVRSDGTVLWTTRVSGTGILLGLADLDGDGKQEVIVYTGLGALALDVQSGAVAWAQQAGEMGAVGGVRMADMNGDGLPDLVIEECRGCIGSKTQTGYIYSFAGGFSMPNKVPLPYPQTNAGPEVTCADMMGTGADQLLLLGPENLSLALVDGASGTVSASGPPLAAGPTYVAGCLPANLDASPGQEVICVTSTGSAPVGGPGDTSEVFALTFQGNALAVLWTLQVPDQAISADAYDLAVDLVGDGTLETLVTAYDAGGNPTVYVLDATKGTVITSIPGGRLAGTAPLGSGRMILTTAPDQVSLWSYAGGAAAPLGTIVDDSVGGSIDWARFAITAGTNVRPISLDVNGDGLPDILTGDTTTGQVHVYTPGVMPPELIGTLSPPPNTGFAGVWPLPAMDEPYPQLGFTETDGTLHFVDKTSSFTSASIPVGGYYVAGTYDSLGTSPVVASLDGGPAQRILVSDSRQVLVAIDASAATPTQPPVEVWEQPTSLSPVVAPGAGGSAAGIFVLHVVDPHAAELAYTLRLLHPDGSTAWEAPIGAGLGPRQDLVLADFDADGTPDVALQVSTPNASAITTNAISGADGHTLWSAATTGCPGASALSIVDWNGDGIDDVVFQSNGTFIASGVDGTSLATGGPPDCYYLPIPFDANGDGMDDLVYTAGANPVQAYAHDLTTQLFAATDQDQPFPYGAIATCPSGLVLVEGSAAFPSRLKLTALDGPDQGTATSVFLAGGALYADQASANAVGVAQLSAVNVHQNLTGTGGPSALVGSGDGWLYAVDPCAGTLTFTYDFGAPVGEPVFGDTDGDGLDEIVVSVADGYLYALRNTIPPPGTGGAGGSGGAGSSSSASSSGTGGGPWIPLYGRAGCYCAAGPASPAYPASLAFAVGLLVALARRSRPRGARRASGLDVLDARG